MKIVNIKIVITGPEFEEEIGTGIQSNNKEKVKEALAKLGQDIEEVVSEILELETPKSSSLQ